MLWLINSSGRNHLTVTAYISGVGAFLPNSPVGNNEIEHLLGQVGGVRSRSKALVLRSNGIKTRYYAIDPATRKMTHTNRELTLEAIRDLCERTGFPLSELACLACGTSSPDQFMPGHAVMVHAELGAPPCETVSTAGVCCSGMTAFKYGYLSVLSGATRNAITTGSELASISLRSENLEPRHETASEDQAAECLRANPGVALEADFLRWMLSDAAAAVLITDEPRGEGVSLRIDWVEIISMAHMAEPCMYAGAEKREDGTLLGFRDVLDLRTAVKLGHFQLKQDAKQLGQLIMSLGGEAFDIARKRNRITAEEYDWFLPHYSSEYFRNPMAQALDERGFSVPQERWFTNLTYKGNTGSASIFIILEELLNGGRLGSGQKILCMVPESARFNYAFMQLTAV